MLRASHAAILPVALGSHRRATDRLATEKRGTTHLETELDRELAKAQAALLARYAPDTRVRRIRWSQGETQLFELGNGAPLLYVHGGLGGAFELVPILRALAENHRVLVVDRPGHGFADPFDYHGVDLLDHARTFLGDILIAGDAIDTAEHLERDLWTHCPDHEAARHSGHHLQQLAAEKSALLLYGHDTDQWQTLRLSPNYYD